MPSFLHLSDFHLVSDNAPTELIGDYKIDVVEWEDKQRRQARLEYTLRDLAASYSQSNQSFDAVLMTGDIANISNTDGFARFTSLIDELKPALPDDYKNKIVVVPGNHDVLRDSKRGSRERYERFLNATRDQGYITPVLDGVDIDSSGKPKRAITRNEHYLLAPDRSWLIIPISCADYYQSIIPLDAGISKSLWDTFEKGLKISDISQRDKHANAAAKMRRVDVARVSNGQLAYWRRELTEIEAELRKENYDITQLTRIVLLHHHLAPVSTVEEFKSFEGITNLEAFRQFLKTSKISVVFHGHKHVSHTYRDYIYDIKAGAEANPYPVFVVSGGTIDKKGDDAARIVALNEPMTDADTRLFNPSIAKAAPTIMLKRVPIVQEGGRLNVSELETKRYTLFLPVSLNVLDAYPTSTVLDDDVRVVYARLMEAFISSGQDELYNVVCQIHNPETIEKLSEYYSDVPNTVPAIKADWFSEVVSWWQKSKPSYTENELPNHFFNHGERISNYQGNINQFRRAVQQLSSGKPTSKAVITLVDPTSDDISSQDSMFPSFCLVQFVIRTINGRRYLTSTAYFRKQEMRCWWPINVTEIYHLQKRVLEEIAPKVRRLRLGSITTISNVATIHVGIPRVAIPAIDRAYELEPTKLTQMAFSLSRDNSVSNRNEMHELWKSYLNDMIPQGDMDEDGVPVAIVGLRELSKLVNNLVVYGGQSGLSGINQLLDSLLKRNTQFARETQFGASAEHYDYDAWKQDANSTVSALI
jgi:3',5'-cyclic AMP phosphodiesterase CpdA